MKRLFSWLALIALLSGAMAWSGETAAQPQFSGNYLNNVVRALDFSCRTEAGEILAEFAVPDAGWVWLEFSAPVQTMQLSAAGKTVADASVLVDAREFMIDLEAEKGFSRANVHRIIFVPSQCEVMLTLTDAESKEPVGTQLQINFVQVKPYFAPEMMER